MEFKTNEMRLTRLEQNVRDLWFGLICLFGFIPILAGNMVRQWNLIFIGAVIIIIAVTVRIVGWISRRE